MLSRNNFRGKFWDVHWINLVILKSSQNYCSINFIFFILFFFFFGCFQVLFWFIEKLFANNWEYNIPSFWNSNFFDTKHSICWSQSDCHIWVLFWIKVFYLFILLLSVNFSYFDHSISSCWWKKKKRKKRKKKSIPPILIEKSNPINFVWNNY